MLTCKSLATGKYILSPLLIASSHWLCALDATRPVPGNKDEPNPVTI